MAFLDDIIKRAKEERKTIVLPEATDLRTLKAVDLISKEDLDKYTLFDLSMVSKLDYYDGIMLKGYFKNLYKEILSGGRYDGLTESFGRRVPAIGFTIYFDALMEAINR